MNAPIQMAEVRRIAEALAPLCEDDDTLFSDMMEGESDLFSIVGRLHAQIARDEEMLVGIAERQANLAERKKRISDRITVSKSAVGQFLRAAQMTKIELPEATYSVRDGKPKLEIVNEQAVPDEFCDFIRKPFKSAINAEFANADDLPNWIVREPARDVVTKRDK